MPRRPSLQAKTDHFQFATRVNFKSSITFLLYSQSFFAELIRNFFHEFESGVQTEVTTVVLNDELAIVGLSGEPFCQHSLRLRQARICRGCSYSATVTATSSTFRLLKLPPREAMAPTPGSLRSPWAQAR